MQTNSILRKVGAGIAGIVVAVVLVLVFETIGHSIWPAPDDLDVGNADVMRAYVDTLPLGAMLTVAFAWFAGALGGTFAACRLGTARPLVYALLVGGFMTAGGRTASAWSMSAWSWTLLSSWSRRAGRKTRQPRSVTAAAPCGEDRLDEGRAFVLR